MAVTRKLLAIALIATVTWTLRRAVLLVDAAVLGATEISAEVTFAQRALCARVRMRRRIALVLIAIFAFAAVLASAPDSGASFNLQCELREKAITFLQQNYPHALSRIRQEQRVAPLSRATSESDQPDHPLAVAARAHGTSSPADHKAS